MEIGCVGDAQLDVRLANMAARQHGVVALWQLEALGLSRGRVARRVGKAQLHRLYRGVYAVGHTRVTVRGRWMAAVLACGPEAVLSHHAAAALWELRTAPTGRIDVTAPHRREHTGIRGHTSQSLTEPDRTVLDGIPVTSLERTLLDVAGTLSPQRLRSILEGAQRRDLLHAGRLDALIALSSGHRGTGCLKAVLARLTDHAPWTQSELERRFLELVRGAGLPEPQCNVLVAGELVDFYWPQQRLVVEVDGYAFHKGKRAFEDDRRRDMRLQLAGIRVVRITYERLVHGGGEALVHDIRRLLIGSAAA